jgi:hypothetical protein
MKNESVERRGERQRRALGQITGRENVVSVLQGLLTVPRWRGERWGVDPTCAAPSVSGLRANARQHCPLDTCN